MGEKNVMKKTPDRKMSKKKMKKPQTEKLLAVKGVIRFIFFCFSKKLFKLEMLVY